MDPPPFFLTASFVIRLGGASFFLNIKIFLVPNNLIWRAVFVVQNCKEGSQSCISLVFHLYFFWFEMNSCGQLINQILFKLESHILLLGKMYTLIRSHWVIYQNCLSFWGYWIFSMQQVNHRICFWCVALRCHQNRHYAF